MIQTHYYSQFPRDLENLKRITMSAFIFLGVSFTPTLVLDDYQLTTNLVYEEHITAYASVIVVILELS